MQLYSTLLRARHGVPVRSSLVLLRPAADGPELTGVLEQLFDRLSEVSAWDESFPTADPAA
jgi:hypothetical protein